MGSTVILGAGITGLCAGYRRKRVIYESLGVPGGICASYYIGSTGASTSKGCYRFEKGGGHWIFGNDKVPMDLLTCLSPVKEYVRRASVYFQDQKRYVPYPLQGHLSALPAEIRNKIRDEETASCDEKDAASLKEWLTLRFGNTLSDLFFLPFHDLYTAGLTARISPQDFFKSPKLCLKVLKASGAVRGYNASFAYPRRGLDHFISQLDARCDVRYKKRAVRIDMRRKKILFQDGSVVAYKKLISTIPLNELVRICALGEFERSDPHTSVLVLNIGATRGRKCPKDHWVYVPKSRSGFHRVGFYSNVEASFLPENSKQKDLVSLYVEKAFLPGDKPDRVKMARLAAGVIAELKEWQYIKKPKVISPSWIGHAYTWQAPGSAWREEALRYLEARDIHSIGRYGAWKFQGILESMKDGLSS